MNLTDDIARAGRDAITGQHIGEYDYLVAITLDEAEELARYVIEAVAPLIAAKTLRDFAEFVMGPSPDMQDAATCRSIAFAAEARAYRIEEGES